MADKAFIDFYSTHNISPVSQDISDENHFQRREALFRSLGIVPSFVRDRTVLEFGPGSGHNAVYIASLNPSVYELVDVNPKGIYETREKLQKFDGLTFQVHDLYFDKFDTDYRYDLVWAEGCLPHQNRPLTLLKHMQRFVNNGGLFAISTSNGVSYLSETLRRLFRDRFFPPDGITVQDQILQIEPYLSKHLSNLKGMSRPVEDWLLDNIVQPLQNRQLMSLPEAVSTLGNDFEVYGTCPKFLTDWRWYKEIVGEDRGFNDNALEAYYRTNLNLLDYRFEFAPHSVELGQRLEELGTQSWYLMCQIEKGDEKGWSEIWETLDEICALINQIAPETVASIEEASLCLKGNTPDLYMRHFPKWWGRGQQYISFIRKDF